MGKKKVSDEEILIALANPDLKQRKDIAKSLNISAVTLWNRTNNIPNCEQLVLDIIKEATVIIAIDGFKEMARIITNGRQDKDKIQAFKLILQYRGELIDPIKLMGDKNNPIVHEHQLGKGMTEEEVINIAQSLIDKE